MEVREKALVEATRLLAQRGFKGTSLQAVADAVGVKKPSLLYHYSSKEELRKAVLDYLMSRWSEVLPKLLMASTLTGLAKFDAVFKELMEFFVADPDRARLLLRELLDRPEAMQRSLDTHVRPWVEVVAEYIRKGQESGQIKPDVDPETYVLQVATMVLAGFAATESIAALLSAKKRKAQIDRSLSEIVRMARSSLFTEGYLAHQSSKEKEKRHG